MATIGLGVALDFMMDLGMENIAAHEDDLRDYAVSRLSGLNWLNLQGTTPDKAAIFSFTLMARPMPMTFQPCSTRRAWRCGPGTIARHL